MIYIAVYAGLLLLGFLSFKDPALRRAIFPVLTGLLFAFVAFRFEVGCDWSGYQANYEAARYLTAHEAAVMQEPGFWLLLTQIHAFNLEYPYLNLIMATPFFWGIVVFARRQPDPLAFLILSFPVLIINMPMSALRQAAAIGFVCLAFVAFHDRKLVRYLVMVAAAALFHTSAIIFLALAPFVRLRLTRVTVAIAVALVLPGMYSIFAESAEFYTDRYIGTGIDAAGGLYRAAMLAVVGVFFLLALRRVFKERFPADYQLTLIGAWIMLGTLAILPLSTVMSDRFGYYVTPIQLMILAQLPQLVPSGPQRLLIRTAPYIALGIVLVIWTTHSTLFHQCFLPYQTWLSWRG